MHKKDLDILKKKDVKDLNDLLKKKKSEADQARVAMGAGKEKNPRKHKFMRREIAQILTIIREKEIITNSNFLLEKDSSKEKTKNK